MAIIRHRSPTPKGGWEDAKDKAVATLTSVREWMGLNPSGVSPSQEDQDFFGMV